ncbi:hypothetical protein H8D83_02700 [Candidatus Woesearchaeota archaeon]|nr:hypothetical protein [Candidatus Woesearchaeota archaeon]
MNIAVINTCDYRNSKTKEISKTPDFVNNFPAHCMENTNGAKYNLQNLNENTLKQAIEKTQENVEQIVLDWKGLGNEKQRIIELLKKINIKNKTKRIKKIKPFRDSSSNTKVFQILWIKTKDF